jgi:ribosomal protein L11 methyltransferase
MNARKNPFYQPSRQWQIRILAHRDCVPAIDEAFSDIALATLDFEVREDEPEWCIDIITDVLPEKAEIDAKLELISYAVGIKISRYECKELEPKDWVSEVERSFPPITIGRFYVYGSHVKSSPPPAKLALKVNAGIAFGSGEHATTSSCLLALDILARKHKFLNPLDMGCGSGILAIAMAKLWRVPVTGIDVDPVSVKVSRENAKHNKISEFTIFEQGNGYNAPLVKYNAPYDLIVANILARPLVKMAPSLARNLDKGGYAVLSGLLVRQEKMVLSAHRAQGLKLVFRICREGWSTLVLRN